MLFFEPEPSVDLSIEPASNSELRITTSAEETVQKCFMKQLSVILCKCNPKFLSTEIQKEWIDPVILHTAYF